LRFAFAAKIATEAIEEATVVEAATVETGAISATGLEQYFGQFFERK